MREVDISELNFNPVTMIDQEWMLITAGVEGNYNTMTASWGHIGSIWGHGKKAATSCVYVRPQRYTKEFVDREPLYTLSFFGPEYKNALGYLGSHSGRDGDKVAHVGMHPVFEDDTTYFAEAKLVLFCRKLYQAPVIEEGFHDKELMDDCYPKKDFHDLYVGQIVKVLVKE